MKFLFFFLSLVCFCLANDRGWNSLDLAKAYKDHSELQNTWACELLENYSFAGKEHVLDFGCGDGKITAKISCLLPEGKVIGVDLSEHMIHLAKNSFLSSNHPNLEFMQTSSKNFEEMQGSFDVITSFSVFHFVDDPIKILYNFKKHLNKDGCLLLTIPLPPNSTLRLAANEYFSKYNLSPPWNHPAYSNKLSMRSIEGCNQKLEEAGFKIIFMEKLDTPSIFQNRDELIDWLIGTASANWAVPFEVSKAFFRDVVEKMLELDPAPLHEDGTITLSQPRIHVIAR